MSLAGICAVSWAAEIKVVGRFDPFQRTSDELTKLVPVTVRVNAAPPAVAELGMRLIRVGAGGGGCVIVNGRGFELPPPAPLLRTTALAALDGPTPPPNQGRLLPGTRVALASLADLEDAPTVPSILRAVLALVLALPLASGCATVEPVKRTTEYQAPGVYAVTLVYPGLRVQEASLLLTTFCQGEADRLGCRSASVGSAKEEVAPPKEGSPEGTPPKETTVITGTLQCGPSTGAAAGGQP